MLYNFFFRMVNLISILYIAARSHNFFLLSPLFIQPVQRIIFVFLSFVFYSSIVSIFSFSSSPPPPEEHADSRRGEDEDSSPIEGAEKASQRRTYYVIGAIVLIVVIVAAVVGGVVAGGGGSSSKDDPGYLCQRCSERNQSQNRALASQWFFTLSLIYWSKWRSRL